MLVWRNVRQTPWHKAGTSSQRGVNVAVAHPLSLNVIEKRVIASDTQRARSPDNICSLIHGISVKTISRKLLTYEVCGMEVKKLIFDHLLDIREEPAPRSSVDYFS